MKTQVIPESIKLLQAVVYTMCGGGELGRRAAEKPGFFYIDNRAGRLPFPRRQIKATVRILSDEAVKVGLDAFHLEPMPDEIRRCDIFDPDLENDQHET